VALVGGGLHCGSSVWIVCLCLLAEFDVGEGDIRLY